MICPDLSPDLLREHTKGTPIMHMRLVAELRKAPAAAGTVGRRDPCRSKLGETSPPTVASHVPRTFGHTFGEAHRWSFGRAFELRRSPCGFGAAYWLNSGADIY